MSAFRSILVAADFSEASRGAFALACSLAREDESRLTVLNVRGTVEVADEHHEAAFDRLRAAYVPGRPLAVDYLVRDGVPAATVLAAAAERACNLLVMGTHGRTGLKRLLTGSVAETVLRQARCPVLILRSPEQPHATPAARGVKERAGRTFRTIVHPTDFSDCSNVALRVARDLARDHGAHLILLHVVSVIEVPHLDGPAAVEDPDACRQTLEEMCECLDDADLKYPARPLLKLGQSAAGILRIADETGCDLLVMGTHGRTGLGRLLMGSVAEQVLRRAECPVLLIKAAVPTFSTAAHDPVASQSRVSAASPGGP